MGLGEGLALASALAWAFGVILYKQLGAHLSPLALNLAKNLIVLAALVPLLLVWHGSDWPWPNASAIAICLLSGLIGIGIADTLYFRALNRIGAGRMGIVGNIYSPFVIVLAVVFLGERLNLAQIGGFALVTAGVLAINQPHGHDDVPRRELAIGIVTGVLAVLLMAIAIVMVKRVLEAGDVMLIAAIRMVGGVLGMLALAAVLRLPIATPHAPLGGRGIGMLVTAALVGQLLSMLLWLGGFKYTSASIAAILNETASVWIVLLAWLLLREPMSARRIVGIALTISGVSVMLI